MKVIIPMAGLGSRFSNDGYTDPKPLIEFLGKPMIQHVVEHVGLSECEHIFLCQKSHIKKYKLHDLFASFVSNFRIVEVDGLTEGAAITVSLADSVMRADDPFMIVNSDQLVYWDRDLTKFGDADGCIYCFFGNGPKWSYAAIDENGTVRRVAEKVQISEHATSGMYYWKRWSDFKAALTKMINLNDRVNQEFYVAPVYNYANGKIIIKHVDNVEQVGTPEELNAYLQKVNNPS
jgi:NDP-sugar pyrophosphorylase family protein